MTQQLTNEMALFLADNGIPLAAAQAGRDLLALRYAAEQVVTAERDRRYAQDELQKRATEASRAAYNSACWRRAKCEATLREALEDLQREMIGFFGAPKPEKEPT